MDNYLVDRQILNQFVDILIKTKFNGRDPEGSAKLKEDASRLLDQRITDAVFGKLGDSQLEELDKILNNSSSTDETFTNFFEKNNINLQHEITTVFENFKTEFLGGENA